MWARGAALGPLELPAEYPSPVWDVVVLLPLGPSASWEHEEAPGGADLCLWPLYVGQ